MFLEVEEGGRDLDEEAVKVYLIRFMADLPQGWYTGSVIEDFFPSTGAVSLIFAYETVVCRSL